MSNPEYHTDYALCLFSLLGSVTVIKSFLVFHDLEIFEELLVRCFVERLRIGVCLMDQLSCDVDANHK